MAPATGSLNREALVVCETLELLHPGGLASSNLRTTQRTAEQSKARCVATGPTRP